MSTKPEIKKIYVPGAAAPPGHYTPGMVHNGTLYISGQLPVNPDGTHNFDKLFEVQARTVLNNLLAVVKAAGAEPANLLKVTVYVVGIDNWKTFNEIYIELLGDIKPARVVVPVTELHHGYLVEVEAIAAV
jgi:2-iminobutanoate/2-iminopropanoate deaminase